MSAHDDFSLHDDEELSLHDDASLAGSVPATNKEDAPAKPPQIITTNTLSNIKLPVLQKDDYDTWAMEMEHYLEYIDNEVWKVIQNGNSKKRVTKGKDGVYRVLPPTTQEEQFADEKERKARTLLLMAVPKDHLRSYHYLGSNAPSYPPKPKNPPPPKKDNPAKDAICHHCGEVGHWRRNCPIYLTELLKKKQLSQGASTSGIFTIELYYFPSTSWVYDTGCGTHICNAIQGLRGSKKLNPGALSLYTGNGQRAAVKAIGNYCFEQLSYAPSITRGIILVSRLYDDGFINRFELNNAIFVSKNNVIYFRAIPRDGVYEIEMSCSNTNDSSMYAVSNKRAKLNLDSSL
ncbi:zinc finger, CCHC-type containing protein [Tanacetum coccineum]